MPVEEHVAFFREETVGGSDGLPFGCSAEGLYFAIRCAVDRSGRPVGAVFRISKAFTVAGLAELATCIFGRSPPYTGLQAVFQPYHGFCHIMHLVGSGMLAIFSHGREKLGETVEASGQLVSVAFV